VLRLRAFGLAALLAVAAACGRTEPVVPRPVPPVQAEAPDAGLKPCVTGTLELQPAVPTVMFVIDRSGSMADMLDGRSGRPRRWDVLASSLRATLPQHDADLAVGAVLFPGTGAGDGCQVSASADLVPKTGNAGALLDLFARQPLGGTPTFAAVNLAASQLAGLRAAGGSRALVLTTDGAPNCNPSLDVATCTCTAPSLGFPAVCLGAENCLDDARTIAAVAGAFTGQHLPTYVVGLGTDTNQFRSTLDNLALAGGVPRLGPGHNYYSAASEQELTDALTRITEQLTRCTYLTNTALGPSDVMTLLVDGGVVLPGSDGWEWTDQANGELRLLGSTCVRAVSGEQVSARLECR